MEHLAGIILGHILSFAMDNAVSTGIFFKILLLILILLPFAFIAYKKACRGEIRLYSGIFDIVISAFSVSGVTILPLTLVYVFYCVLTIFFGISNTNQCPFDSTVALTIYLSCVTGLGWYLIESSWRLAKGNWTTFFWVFLFRFTVSLVVLAIILLLYFIYYGSRGKKGSSNARG